MTARPQIIAVWISDLAGRVSPSMTTEQVEILARDFSKGLADMPEQVFDELSREGAARTFDRFPTYKALRKFLQDWHGQQHKTASAALSGPEDPSLSAEERANVISWQRFRATNPSDSLFSQRLRMLRDVLPKVFGYILRTDAQAEFVARQRGWLREDDPVDVSEHGITRNLLKLEPLAGQGPLGAALASLGLSMLRKAVEAHAPDRLHLLPERIVAPPRQERERSVDEQIAAMGETSEQIAERLGIAEKSRVQHGRKPGALSPEQLAAARRVAGVQLPDMPEPQPFPRATPSPTDPLFPTDDEPPAQSAAPADVIDFSTYRFPWDDEETSHAA